MINTIALFVLLTMLIFVSIYFMVRPGKSSPKFKLIAASVIVGSIAVIILGYGIKSIRSDISRLFLDSAPRSPEEVYSVLFKHKKLPCASIINIRDEVVPYIDCCVWIEMRACRQELDSILANKNYKITGYDSSKISDLLLVHKDSPSWWSLKFTGDSIFKASVTIRRSRQTVYFGKDSTKAFICDESL